MSYSEQFRLWNTKRAWCVEQGWEENIDFWPPGMISGEWHFHDPRNLTLFLLRWS